jgi:hypothetical protein
MQIYNYHPKTGEYTGASQAEKDPKHPDQFLMPAYSTDVAPPKETHGLVAVFNDNAWQLKEDHRGKILYTSQGAEIEVYGLGAIPDGLLLEKPVIEATLQEQQSAVRQQRNQLLLASDVFVTRHRDQSDMSEPLATLTQSEYQILLRYRQKLRDLPQQQEFATSPQYINFPTKPNFIGG